MNAMIPIAREAAERGRRQGQKDAVEAAVSVMALALLDSGLCRNTTRKIANKAFRLFESIRENRLSLVDVRKTLLEEYDFEINFLD